MTPSKLKGYWKAIGGLLGPSIGLFIIDLSGGVTQSEWLHIAAAALGGGVLVTALPSNKKAAK